MGEVSSLLALLATISASILGIVALFKGVIIPFCRWAKATNKTLHEHFVVLPAKITRIYQEVTPNGGTSLKDSVHRIETRQLIQEQRQHAYVSHLDVPIFETDAVGNCTWINKAYLEFVGASPEEILGTGWLNFIEYEDQAKVAEHWAIAVRDHRAFRLEYEMLTPTGKVKVVSDTTVVRDNAGQLLGYIGTFFPTE